MASDQITSWIKAQELRGPSMKKAPVFYRNLEEALDQRRTANNIIALSKRGDSIDFSSNDFLSLAPSAELRNAFLDELNSNPGFSIGSTGSRLLDGNGDYIEALERDIAAFHRAETALVLSSGYDGNGAIFNAVPRPGDVVLFDELVHASVHDGMKHSLAQTQLSFRHNDVDGLREALADVKTAQPLVRQGSRCAIIAVEAVYSMDGDVCPLREFVDVAREELPRGNWVFVVDEAHSTGVIGEDGRGLVCALGLEKDIAVRLHTYGKALATTGAAILCNETVRNTLLNFARPLIYTTAPSFPMLASIRAGYKLLTSGQTRQRQARVKHLVRHFCRSLTSNASWPAITGAGICSVPLSDDWESRPDELTTQFVPVWTRHRYNYYLMFHLQTRGIFAFPIGPPVVPRGTGRIRLVVHADNTEAQVEALAAAICEWGAEMLDIETGGGAPLKIPRATRKVYELMAASSSAAAASSSEGADAQQPADPAVQPALIPFTY